MNDSEKELTPPMSLEFVQNTLLGPIADEDLHKLLIGNVFPSSDAQDASCFVLPYQDRLAETAILIEAGGCGVTDDRVWISSDILRHRQDRWIFL
jgi:hypothetical protein